MFRKNEKHHQQSLFGWKSLLSQKKMEQLEQSSGYAFYQLIFCNIREEDFQVLYSDKYSAPNAPVNCMVGAMLLQQKYAWSYEELMEQIDYNIQIRIALGLKDLNSRPFTERTLFNFKKRLAGHHAKTGENLLEKVFDRLTEDQIEKLCVKTHIQRADTVLLATNIRSYTRLSLLVELLRRLHRILSKADQDRLAEYFKPYEKGGEKYVYKIKSGSQAEHLEKLAKVYYCLYEDLQSAYGETEVFQLFQRVYQEHFKLVDSAEKISVQVRPNEELRSDCLQSPDDAEATFRKKRDEEYQGFGIMGAETCVPENPVNLVTKIAVATNNKDDSVILEEKVDEMKQATPDLDQLHVDGGFGSKGIDEKAEELNITIVQTAIKGPKAKVPMDIQGDEQTGYTVTCPNPDQEPAQAQIAEINYVAAFTLAVCLGCPLRKDCPACREVNYDKGVSTYRFSPQDVRKQKRHKALQKIPKELQTLRPGVEPLMRQMRRGEKNTGKLKIRGQFNFELYAFSMGIVINFERIFRYLKAKSSGFLTFCCSHALWHALFQRTSVKSITH